MVTKIETNAEYHSNKRHLSSSAVKTIASRSVYHLLNSSPYKETEDMMLGTAIHAKMLEPISFDETYVVMVPFNGTTREGKAIKADYVRNEAEGKILLKANHGDIITGLYNSTQKNELALKYLIGDIELSHYSEFMGVPVKVRPDVKGVDFISDIKTCQDASPKAFRYDVYKYKWHIQAAFYCAVLGYTMDQFKFIAMQKNYPYDVVVYTLSEQMQQEGYDLMVDAVGKWKRYIESGEVGYFEWPKHSDGSFIL